MAEKTEQELLVELARLQCALNDARKYYHNRGVYIDLEFRINRAYDLLMGKGLTADDINLKLKNGLI